MMKRRVSRKADGKNSVKSINRGTDSQLTNILLGSYLHAENIGSGSWTVPAKQGI